MDSKFKRVLFFLITTSIFLLSGVFIAELTLRFSSMITDGLNPTVFFEGLPQIYNNVENCNPYEVKIRGAYIPNLTKDHSFIKSDRCKEYLANNIGIHSTYDYPNSKSSEHFNILVLGGSVAFELARNKDHGFLEKYLSEHFESPSKKPIRVYAGSLGGWHQPTQINMALMYGFLFDLVISIEGYNELSANHLKLPIDYIFPEETFFYNNISLTSKYLTQWISFVSRNRNSKIVNKSYLIAKITSLSLYILSKNVEHEKSNIQRHQLEKFYSDFNLEDYTKYNLLKYKAHLNSLIAISKTYNAKLAIMAQPIRWIDKALTINERRYEKLINVETYRKFLKLLEELRSLGAKTYSLTGIAKNVDEEMYIDHIHFDSSNQKGGYYLMAKAVGKILQKDFNFKNK